MGMWFSESSESSEDSEFSEGSDKKTKPRQINDGASLWSVML